MFIRRFPVSIGLFSFCFYFSFSFHFVSFFVLFFCGRMISAWDTFFEVDEYYTYKKPVGHGAYGVVISALDTRNDTKVRR